jgi:hypothetical protein
VSWTVVCAGVARPAAGEVLNREAEWDSSGRRPGARRRRGEIERREERADK